MAPPRSRRSRITATTIFLSLFLTVVVGAHYYLASRLVLDPNWPTGFRIAGLTLIGAFCVLLVAEPIAARRLSRGRSRVLAWPASVWMGFAFLGLVVLGLSDLALSLVRGLSSVFFGEALPEGSEAFYRLQAGMVLAATILLSGVGLREGLRQPRIRRVEIELERWPRERDGFRIVQISDIHISALRGRAFAESLTRRVNALDADLVAVTVDLVDGKVSAIGPEVEPFSGLRAPFGVYFVTGNHDHYSGAEDWVARVEELGLCVLRNRHVLKGEGAFAIAGVDDHRGSMTGDAGGEDLERALAGIPAEMPVVLLAHDPATFPEASRHHVDLQLSGHTHAGQIWPFRYLVRLSTPFVEGLHRRARSTLYVSRGTGFWGPPMRLGAPAEITEIVLRRSSTR